MIYMSFLKFLALKHVNSRVYPQYGQSQENSDSCKATLVESNNKKSDLKTSIRKL